MTAAAFAITRLVSQIVAFLGPQVLKALFFAPASSAAARAQVGQHGILKLLEAVLVHPHAFRARFIVADDFDRVVRVAGIYCIVRGPTLTGCAALLKPGAVVCVVSMLRGHSLRRSAITLGRSRDRCVVIIRIFVPLPVVAVLFRVRHDVKEYLYPFSNTFNRCRESQSLHFTVKLGRMLHRPKHFLVMIVDGGVSYLGYSRHKPKAAYSFTDWLL